MRMHIYIPTNILTKYQPYTPYGSETEQYFIQDIKGQGHCSKVRGKIKVTHDVAQLHPPNNAPTKC